MEQEYESLTTMEGVAAPPTLNPNRKHRRKALVSVPDLFGRLGQGDSVALAQAITLIESHLPAHRLQAKELVTMALAAERSSVRLGITGPPGVGKSSLIETLGLHLISECHHRIAVLAVDPSSLSSKGSILGDKSRMPHLSANQNAFIRPSPTSGSLGGVAQTTRETILLCEAAKFDVVIVETVGVGQSETHVHQMVDCFLCLSLAHSGDELQGIKRGVLELSDIIRVTKADGENEPWAKVAAQQIRNALHLMRARPDGWTVPVGICSSQNGVGIPEIWMDVLAFLSHLGPDHVVEKRKSQEIDWMKDLVVQGLMQRLTQTNHAERAFTQAETQIMRGQWDARQAAEFMIRHLLPE
ncbi:MAG: methylmalonyl Co-A mutase-associated GTPase MeaB [Fimbriimonadaceae bacterium]|jgi:LAO/AO transport system kinase|nr:methylmalonyl Co-A mutase-associated GTPase MeaB [Fimbriimonadaceae bacterium]